MRRHVLEVLAIFVPLSFSAVPAVACDNYPLSQEQRNYLEELSLNLEIPQGNFAEYVPSTSNVRPPSEAKPECWLSQDFNGDGVEDFAGLFQYTGEKPRASGWDLDLVILYSDEGQLRHYFFPYAGQITAEGSELRQHLGLQAPGRVNLDPGTATLVNPAIVSYRDKQPAAIFFWNEKHFTTLAYFTDD